MRKVQKNNFFIPHQRNRVAFSLQTISRVIHSIIGYNYRESDNYFCQRIFIDFMSVQWVATQILEWQIFNLYFHPLLLRQALVKLESEISNCHQDLNISRAQRNIKVNRFSHNQIISSIRKIYRQV